MRASGPAFGLRYGIRLKRSTPAVLGGLPKGFKSNLPMDVIRRLDFASSAQAPVVESDGDERVFTSGFGRCVLLKRLAKETSFPTRGLPGEYGEKAATRGEILGDWMAVGSGELGFVGLGDRGGVRPEDRIGDWVVYGSGACF